MNKATCRVDGLHGQRITYEKDGRYATLERMDGRRVGDRKVLLAFDEREFIARVAGKLHWELIDDGRCVRSGVINYGDPFTYRVNRARHLVIKHIKRFLDVERLPARANRRQALDGGKHQKTPPP